ncbi:MAG: hypothetical protein IKD69_12745 [Solobacterium sp.]|nr:hypothetical protein [Solobacterium sp.]
MSKEKKKALIEEAQMQSKALQRIGQWRTIALFLAAVGVVFAWLGFSRTDIHWIVGVFGILMTVISFLLALVFNIGIRNGNRNVQKILDAAEKE